MNVQWNENECHVLKRRELLQNVKQNAVAHGRVLSNEAIDSYCQKLFSYTQVLKEQKQEHIHNIEEKYKPISRNAVNTDALICPWCGGKLALRTPRDPAKASRKFYGCSNYPKCRFTRNIM